MISKNLIHIFIEPCVLWASSVICRPKVSKLLAALVVLFTSLPLVLVLHDDSPFMIFSYLLFFKAYTNIYLIKLLVIVT